MNIKRKIKNYLPKVVVKFVEKVFFTFFKNLYKVFPRPYRPAETTKAKSRRQREGFFDEFCCGKGLDVGYGGDKLCDNCQGWDIENGNAQTLKGLANNSFDFVYSSHCLEHLDDADEALKNWWRVVKTGGYLILYLPERDLYERKKNLPSRWSTSHKRFFLLDRDESPDTIGVLALIERALANYEILKADICTNGHKIKSEQLQANGEYSIEVVIRKTC